MMVVFQFLGDDRVNEQPGLTLLHVMFMRLHNLYARRIRDKYPTASNEDVFQLARAIVVGVMQKITYDEWLAVILGPDVRKEFGLNLAQQTIYDPNADPRIFQSFSTAAFRCVDKAATPKGWT